MEQVLDKKCETINAFLSQPFSKKSLDLINEYGTIIRCEKGQHIFYEGESVEGIFFVLSGMIKIFKSGLNGKQQIIRLAKPNDIIGHRGLGGKNIYPIGAEAIEDSKVCFIETQLFFEILRNDSEFAIWLILFYAEELKNTETRIRDQAQMSIREKIADAIMMIAKAYGIDARNFLKAQLSRGDIADLAGTNNEQVSRFLSEFEQDNIIELKGKTIKILNLELLKDKLKYYY